jgi:hypothetical protein
MRPTRIMEKITFVSLLDIIFGCLLWMISELCHYNPTEKAREGVHRRDLTVPDKNADIRLPDRITRLPSRGPLVSVTTVAWPFASPL